MEADWTKTSHFRQSHPTEKMGTEQINLLRVMKALLQILIALVAAACCCAQGTVNFSNLDPGAGLNAPMYEAGGTVRLSGLQYMVELLGGSSVTGMVPIGTTSFLTGTNAGYFNGGTQMVPNVPPGSSAYLGVLIWNTAAGSTFGEAVASGLGDAYAVSGPFSDFLGGNGTPPGALVGLTSLQLGPIPEPSTGILCLFGTVILLVRALKRRGFNGLAFTLWKTSDNEERMMRPDAITRRLTGANPTQLIPRSSGFGLLSDFGLRISAFEGRLSRRA